MSDFTGIYVDSETYELIDRAPEWKLNRLRFSLAHEIGHLFLHRELFEDAGIQDPKSLRSKLAFMGGLGELPCKTAHGATY